ncbi:GNAT family N-acetyltransferase [Specibacter cremeus]|uniref:GNAT family N-acetyltransferase n=1 Tax=Specibacter cremeus TaxID=1629051 RepID=UPI00197B9300|nr:GNAT family N-acetyltransferase [Specibacter cremeus]
MTAQLAHALPPEAAGLRFEDLHTMKQMVQANAVLDSIWRSEPNSHFDPALLMALAHAGNYVVGLYDGAEMVGVCVGFFAAPAGAVLHSHIAGVRTDHAGLGLGRLLKEHQRQWCRERGIATITWTFDPLVARNAYFNIARLGAAGVTYLVDFYGEMADLVNAGQPSDRMLASWSVDAPTPSSGSAAGLPCALAVGREGEPVTAVVHASPLALGLPHDIEAVRASDPVLARRWRLALREALAPRLAAGWRITGFDKSGFYLLEGPTHED